MQCKQCKTELEVTEIKDELFYKCPKCGTAFTVPRDYYNKEKKDE